MAGLKDPGIRLIFVFATLFGIKYDFVKSVARQKSSRSCEKKSWRILKCGDEIMTTTVKTLLTRTRLTWKFPLTQAKTDF